MSGKTVRMMISISFNMLLIVLGIYIIVTMGTKAYTFGKRVFNEQAVDNAENARTVEVTITSEISPKKLASMLYDKGLVDDEFVTFFQIQFSDYKNKFVAGTYELNTAMTPTQMMQVMVPSVDDGND